MGTSRFRTVTLIVFPKVQTQMVLSRCFFGTYGKLHKISFFISDDCRAKTTKLIPKPDRDDNDDT